MSFTLVEKGRSMSKRMEAAVKYAPKQSLYLYDPFYSPFVTYRCDDAVSTYKDILALCQGKLHIPRNIRGTKIC